MKFIDEKGRLFGKVNIIDFLIIAFLFSLIPMFYFGYKIFTQKPPEVKKDFIEIEINCNLIKVNPETLTLIKVGDKALDGYGGQIGEITWVGESQPYVYKFQIDSTSTDSPIIITDQALKELPAKIKLKAEVRDTLIYYNGRRILTGLPLLFETAEYNVEAVPVVPVAPVIIIDKKERWVQVKVRFSGIFPELSILISKGHLETDEDGRVIGSLKEIGRISSSTIRVINPETEKLILVSDPYLYDIIVVLDLLVTDRKGQLFYKNYPVKVGSQISFASNLYTVSGIIIGVKELDAKGYN